MHDQFSVWGGVEAPGVCVHMWSPVQLWDKWPLSLRVCISETRKEDDKDDSFDVADKEKPEVTNKGCVCTWEYVGQTMADHRQTMVLWSCHSSSLENMTLGLPFEICIMETSTKAETLVL